MKNLRVFEKDLKIETHPDFEFVTRGSEDVMIVTWGGSSGRVYTNPEDYAHYMDYHLFIRATNEKVVENLVSIEPELLEAAGTYVRAKNCYRSDVVREYTTKFGRVEVMDTLLESENA